MARPFIGDDGFYPDWAKGDGRWVLQRVMTSVSGFMEIVDRMGRNEMSREGLIWVPPNRGGLGRLFGRTDPGDDGQPAIEEVSRIPMECAEQDTCGWRGLDPDGQTSMIRLGLKSSSGPANWGIRCPDCGQVAGPIFTGLNSDLIVRRWQILGRPMLDPPVASPLIESAQEVADLPSLLERLDPMANELAYIGQQLWTSFAAFIAEVQTEKPERLHRGARTIDEVFDDDDARWDLDD
jgi:hypothetical protein